ncbi:ribonuclease H family protein, partial [Klebsiella pneumoniae]|uniref:ribonuclease H family protein n=1 Tax=Klebsiella pneumoniae TaxID=573 RepID=UPI003D364B48
HIVSHEGVKVDPRIKHLRGFIGLKGYYCKFVKNYGRIAAHLTTLLKKDTFSWMPEATKAFENLKDSLLQASVLATLDFTKTFIVECDASGNGIGVVLMKEERPITFGSHQIKGNYLHKAIYEKEMLAILHALKKW